jgi:hypothetical protein
MTVDRLTVFLTVSTPCDKCIPTFRTYCLRLQSDRICPPAHSLLLTVKRPFTNSLLTSVHLHIPCYRPFSVFRYALPFVQCLSHFYSYPKIHWLHFLIFSHITDTFISPQPLQISTWTRFGHPEEGDNTLPRNIRAHDVQTQKMSIR